METTTINILIICCAAAVITFIISIARWIQRVQIKNIEKSIIFDERDRKEKWEEKVLLARDKQKNSLKEENENLKKENNNLKNSDDTIKQQAEKIDSLNKKIEALQNNIAIEYMLMNKLGSTTKEELDKEKKRIQEQLDTIEKYINNKQKYYENTDNNA
jgi:hypothetical protein